MPFVKVESVGNDFVLVHLEDVSEHELSPLAIQTSRRRFDIGSDGLLAVEQAPGGVLLRMFNPDGSEDFCGNGIRCAALYALAAGWTGNDPVVFHGRQQLQTHVSGRVVQTEMSPASFDPASVPLAAGMGELFQKPLTAAGRDLTVSSVTTGSTHTVIFVENLPEDTEFFELGPAIERHPFFPERTSVIWAAPDGMHDLRIRIWERGAGETLGCGTGSSAAAAVYQRLAGVTGTIDVHNPGGIVRVNMQAWDRPFTTEAEARVVFRGSVPLQLRAAEMELSGSHA